MSEPVLRAIMRLFALVAKEDSVTKQERDHIEAFLADHLSQKSVASQLAIFDGYCIEFAKSTKLQEDTLISQICEKINKEVDQNRRP